MGPIFDGPFVKFRKIKMFLGLYICLISVLLALIVPRQRRFRDKLIRRFFETEVFSSYPQCFYFVKLLTWFLLVTCCLFFSNFIAIHS